MPVSKCAWVPLISLLGLFTLGGAAQERVPSRPNGANILVPVGRQLNPIYQSSIEKNGVPSKFYGVRDENEIPSPYEFGFSMNDGNGTAQHRQEIRLENGDIKGSYGYVDPFGVYRKVEYYTDASGYHAKVTSNEPGLDNKNSANAIFVVENPPAVAEKQYPVVLIPAKTVA
ncbi:cuticle protein 14-like [Argiope bruennichi]|uniref:cuticle protein 14-like n=1 Tax=Argiope bruennichi TaxID=94029 RepID=UPI002493E4BA|nr:cuticle protein 14-like [Argiope bruennichi]